MSYLKSEAFLRILETICEERYPYIAFADAFHTIRSMMLPVLYLLGTFVPRQMHITPFLLVTEDFWHPLEAGNIKNH